MVIVNVLHVLGAVFVIGPLVVLPMVGLFAVRLHQRTIVSHLATLTNVFNYVSLAVVLLGFALVGLGGAEEEWSVTTPWILASAVIYLIAFLGTATVVVPQLRLAGKGTAGTGTPAASERYPLLASSAGVVAILLVCIVVLMVAQPGAA